MGLNGHRGGAKALPGAVVRQGPAPERGLAPHGARPCSTGRSAGRDAGAAGSVRQGW